MFLYGKTNTHSHIVSHEITYGYALKIRASFFMNLLVMRYYRITDLFTNLSIE